VFIVHPSLVREPSALSPDNPFASIFQSLIRHIFGQTKHTRYMLLQRFMYTLVVHHRGIKPRWIRNGMLSRWKTRVFHVHVPFCYAASCSLFPCTKPRTLPAFPSLHDASSIENRPQSKSRKCQPPHQPSHQPHQPPQACPTPPLPSTRLNRGQRSSGDLDHIGQDQTQV
jgi:hypothetical protein